MCLHLRRKALGESWTYYYALAVGFDVVVLALVRFAWTWPRSIVDRLDATLLDHGQFRSAMHT